MSQALTPTAEYIRNTLPELRERIMSDMRNMDTTTNKLVAGYRGILGSTLSWIINFETHKDASSIRAMHQMAFKIGGAKSMLDTYLLATGQELPASMVQEYGDFEGLYEAACELAKQPEPVAA